MYQPPSFHPNRPTLVAPVCVDPTGEHGPTRAQARGRRWRTTSRGRHVPATVPAGEPQQRSVEAAALLRCGEAVTGWAGLNWLGGHWFTGTAADGLLLPVPVVTGRELMAPGWIHVSQEHLRGGERVVVDGLPVTDAVRSVSFEARYAPSKWRAVAALDMACYSDLVTIADLAVYAATIGPWTGIGKLRTAVTHGEENSWSPQEVRMRWAWEVEAERPRPCATCRSSTGGGVMSARRTCSTRWPGHWGSTTASYTWSGPSEPGTSGSRGEYRSLGLECVTMIAADHADDHHSFLGRLDTAYGNARYAAEAGRDWTIRPPRWWIDTSTVEARRNLDADTASRLLRYRRAA